MIFLSVDIFIIQKKSKTLVVFELYKVEVKLDR